MIFSIRKRLFLNVVALMVPLCFFAWMLVNETQKQEQLASKEIHGITLQRPLTELLHTLHERTIKQLTSQDTAATDAAIRKAASAFNEVYEEVADDIGMGEAKWKDMKATLDKSLADPSTYADAITTVKALIARASDGSNLTLDPDLDSYYLMDVGSFALPAAIDNIATAEEWIDDLVKKAPATLSGNQYGQIEVIQYKLEADATRITGNLAIALAEDANFNGSSGSLARLQSLSDAYQTQNKALMEAIEQFHTAGMQADISKIREAFATTTSSLVALQQATPEELEVLLKTRIDVLEHNQQTLFTEGGIAVAIGLALFWVISQSIVGPITRLRKVMAKLAGGNVEVEIPYTHKRDEIGDMAKAVAVFKDNAMALRGMATDFDSSVKHVVEIVASAATEMDSASRNLTHQSNENHGRLKLLNDDINTVSGNMEIIAASGEELSASINEISAQVQKSTHTTGQAVAQAENVKKVAEALASSAEQVTNITNLITTIASKINLLALNATIEAARAGEAGKGFAVVASEVKTLANQTASATSEISQLVTAIQTNTAETNIAITSIGGVIEQINHIAGSIAAAVEEQGVAAREIAAHIRQASDRITNVTSNAKKITESTAESAAASSQTLQASGELSKQSETLRSQVDGFMQKLMAS